MPNSQEDIRGHIDLSWLGDNATPFNSLLACEVAMLAKMAKADGRVSKTEVSFLNEVIEQAISNATIKQALQRFANMQKANVDDIFEFAVAATKFAAKSSPKDGGLKLSLSIYYDLFCMALIDGEIMRKEMAILRCLPEALGLKNDSFDIVGKYLAEGNTFHSREAFLSLLQSRQSQIVSLLKHREIIKSGYRNKAKQLCEITRSLKILSELPKDDLNRIQLESSALESRTKDQCLYLGIVGEFSTGKSTFINALLGFELLKEDVLQGTTCAPTLLFKGNDFTITVNFHNGKRPARHPASNAARRSRWCVGDDMGHAFECIGKASEFINKYTAEEDVSKTVADVRIEIPGDHWKLPDNIVVVDTPGLNADNPRHGMVAREAVRNLCDLCCVLTSASIPCPASLVHFVSENLREMQGRCICVATQVDRVRRRERDGLVNYISERLASEGLSFKKVCGVAPIYAAHPDEHHAEAESFRVGFSDFVRALSSMLEQARNDVISEKTGRLIKHLADETLRPMLESMRDEFRRRKNALASNRLSNPDLFFEEASRKAHSSLTCAANHIAQACLISLDHPIDRLRESVERRVNSANSVDEIKAALTVSLSDRLNSSVREELQGYADGCRGSAMEIVRQFKSEFNAAYRNLGRDAPALPMTQTSEITVRLPHLSFSGAVGAVAALDRQDNDQRLGNAGRGAAIGAGIGSFVPVIGTFAGALIGGAIGGIFGGKDISEFRRTAKMELANAVKRLRQKVSNYFKEQSQLILHQIASEMDGQLDFYRKQSPKIRAVIEKEEAEIGQINRLISDANADLRSLTPFINPT